MFSYDFFYRNYFNTNFILDFLATFPFDAIYRIYFYQYRHDPANITITLISFHFPFIFKFFRFSSLLRAQNYTENLMNVSHIYKHLYLHDTDNLK